MAATDAARLRADRGDQPRGVRDATADIRSATSTLDKARVDEPRAGPRGPTVQPQSRAGPRHTAARSRQHRPHRSPQAMRCRRAAGGAVAGGPAGAGGGGGRGRPGAPTTAWRWPSGRWRGWAGCPSRAGRRCRRGARVRHDDGRRDRTGLLRRAAVASGRADRARPGPVPDPGRSVVAALPGRADGETPDPPQWLPATRTPPWPGPDRAGTVPGLLAPAELRGRLWGRPPLRLDAFGGPPSLAEALFLVSDRDRGALAAGSPGRSKGRRPRPGLRDLFGRTRRRACRRGDQRRRGRSVRSRRMGRSRWPSGCGGSTPRSASMPVRTGWRTMVTGFAGCGGGPADGAGPRVVVIPAAEGVALDRASSAGWPSGRGGDWWGRLGRRRCRARLRCGAVPGRCRV